ncbi:unnamed protein product [Protopolystoma xenopodis]|uniref:Uncharacterized protein n=1 Tax=Protopolystoma xenopodis TaxID=117903 RepID=A0A3S5CJE5_9PLAT|nr:unnamed protein product [Protopolystoma xenopodis]
MPSHLCATKPRRRLIRGPGCLQMDCACEHRRICGNELRVERSYQRRWQQLPDLDSRAAGAYAIDVSLQRVHNLGACNDTAGQRAGGQQQISYICD